jgi:hypothetical protein
LLLAELRHATAPRKRLAPGVIQLGGPPAFHKRLNPVRQEKHAASDYLQNILRLQMRH